MVFKICEGILCSSCYRIWCHCSQQVLSLYNPIKFLAILYPKSLTNLVVEVRNSHSQQILLSQPHGDNRCEHDITGYFVVDMVIPVISIFNSSSDFTDLNKVRYSSAKQFAISKNSLNSYTCVGIVYFGPFNFLTSFQKFLLSPVAALSANCVLRNSAWFHLRYFTRPCNAHYHGECIYRRPTAMDPHSMPE